MNKYTWIILAFAAAAMAVYSAVTVTLFSAGLAQQQEVSENRMMALASYCAKNAGREAMQKAGDHAIDRWLSDMCVTTGFERIVITDSSGIVYYSSQPVIFRGEDITPYLVEPELFVSAVSRRAPAFSKPVKIDGTYFRSLYFPAKINGLPCAVVVEADEQYFAAARVFRMNVLSSMISLAVMSALLVVLVAVVSRRAAHTARLARRNEELAFLGRTSAELAHELKNPLAIIKSSVDVIRKKHDLDKKEKPFDFISEEVLRLSRLVDDILTFSRDRNEVFEPFYPHEVIARLSEMLGHEYPETTILDMVSENTVFKGDRDAFTRISMNLIRNSISAMNGRGEIRVAESKDRGKETLDYSDNGPGIPEDLVPRLFDPFVSGSKTGTGLGLAIVRTLCEKCKWEIRLMSHKPGNTCFRISGMIMGK